MAEGKSHPVTEFYEVQPNLSFKEFNEYINSLDDNNKIISKVVTEVKHSIITR